jgi:hypothetical protein
MFWHTATSSLLTATATKVVAAAVAALAVAGGAIYVATSDDSRGSDKAAVAPNGPANRIAPPPLQDPGSAEATGGSAADVPSATTATTPPAEGAPTTKSTPRAAGNTKNTKTTSKQTKAAPKKTTTTTTQAPAPAQVPDTEAPSAPTNLTGVNLGNNQFDSHIILDWDASTDNVGVVGYRIYFRTNMGEWQQVHDIHDGSTDDTVVANEAFARENFAVRAYDTAGNLSEMATVHVEVPFAV